MIVDDWEEESDVLEMLNNGITNILLFIIERNFRIRNTEYYELLQHYKKLLQIPFEKDTKFIIDKLI